MLLLVVDAEGMSAARAERELGRSGCEITEMFLFLEQVVALNCGCGVSVVSDTVMDGGSVLCGIGGC